MDPWPAGVNPDLRGLPPAVIITAGFDPIRDDGLCYAAQLRAAGVPVDLLHYPGQFHGFLNFDSIIGAARDALTRMGASCRVLTAGLLIGRSTRQWSGAAARWLSPEAANVAEFFLRPWWVPAASARRSLTAYLNLPAAQQTYPQP